MELRHLRYFTAVAEELHFTHAAERLHVAQPALSQQIRDLEEELGVTLFERKSRGVELTAAGTAFLEQVRKTLAQADYAAKVAQRAERGEVGRLIVSFVGTMALDVLSDMMRTFRAAYPHVAVDLRDLPSGEQLRALRDGVVDAGFVHDFPAEPELAWLPVRSEMQLVALRSDHPLASRRKIALRDMADLNFVMYPRAQLPVSHQRFVDACHRAGFAPRIVQEATGMFALVGFVAMEVGVAIVPEVLRDIELGGVVFREIEDGLAMETAMVWNPNRVSPTLRVFLEVMRGLAAPQSSSEPSLVN